MRQTIPEIIFSYPLLSVLISFETINITEPTHNSTAVIQSNAEFLVFEIIRPIIITGKILEPLKSTTVVKLTNFRASYWNHADKTFDIETKLKSKNPALKSKFKIFKPQPDPRWFNSERLLESIDDWLNGSQIRFEQATKAQNVYWISFQLSVSKLYRRISHTVWPRSQPDFYEKLYLDLNSAWNKRKNPARRAEKKRLKKIINCESL